MAIRQADPYDHMLVKSCPLEKDSESNLTVSVSHATCSQQVLHQPSDFSDMTKFCGATTVPPTGSHLTGFLL